MTVGTIWWEKSFMSMIVASAVILTMTVADPGWLFSLV
jgi:hypothetical protein